MRIAIWTLGLILSGCVSSGSGVVAPESDRAVLSIRAVAPSSEEDREPSLVRDERPSVGVEEEDLDTAEGRARLGDLYARAGLLPEAIVEYRQSIELDPADAVRHFKLGLAYQSLRRFGEALAAYQEAARLEPDSAWAHAAVSIVQAKMGQQSAAFDSYRTVKRLDGEMAEGLLEVILQYGTFHEV